MEEENFSKLNKHELMEELNKLQLELSSSYSNLQLVKDDGLLDYYAYKIKSEEALHNFLLNEIKKIEA